MTKEIWLRDVFQDTAHDFIFSAELIVIPAVLVKFINLRKRRDTVTHEL